MAYIFNLNTMHAPKAELQNHIGDEFFQSKDYSLVKGGDVDVSITINKVGNAYGVRLHLDGKVVASCDRCADDLDVEVYSDNEVSVRLGAAEQVDEDVVCVDERDGELDLEPLMYDYVILSMPARCVHGEGQCNPDMQAQLDQYLVNTDEDL